MTDKQIKKVFKNGFYCIEPCPEIKELLAKLQAKEQECEELKEDNATLFDKAIEARKECTDLKEQLFLLKIDYAELLKQLDQLKAENDELKKQLKFELDETLLQYSNELDRLKAENEDLKKSILLQCPNCGEEYLNYKGVELYYENNDLKQTLIEIKEIIEDNKTVLEAMRIDGLDPILQIIERIEK